MAIIRLEKSHNQRQQQTATGTETRVCEIQACATEQTTENREQSSSVRQWERPRHQEVEVITSESWASAVRNREQGKCEEQSMRNINANTVVTVDNTNKRAKY